MQKCEMEGCAFVQTKMSTTIETKKKSQTKVILSRMGAVTEVLAVTQRSLRAGSEQHTAPELLDHISCLLLSQNDL